MKILPVMMVCAVAFAPASFAAEKEAPAGDAYDRTVERLRDNASRGITRTDADVSVECTVMPHEKFVAVAFKIENPNKTVVGINPDSIKVSDQVRQFEPINAADVAAMLYSDRTGPDPRTPFYDEWTPPASLIPRQGQRSPAEEDMYRSTVNYSRTDSKELKGIAYYDNYGSSEKLHTEIRVNGREFKFDF